MGGKRKIRFGLPRVLGGWYRSAARMRDRFVDEHGRLHHWFSTHLPDVRAMNEIGTVLKSC